jgi:CRP/FNR family transcriptional regulator
MYYLQPGQACAVSMICATKSQTSMIMAKVVEDVDLIMIPLTLMENGWNTAAGMSLSFYPTAPDLKRVLEVIDNIAFRAMDERLGLS